MAFRSIVRQLFSINTLLLFFIGLSILFSIKSCVQSSYPFDTLIRHEGMVQKKTLFPKIVRQKDDEQLLQVYLSNGEHFVSSADARYLDSLVWEYDSLIIYTKPRAGFFTHLVTDHDQNRVTSTNHYNEMYHIVRKVDGSVILNYEQHIKTLRRTIWLGPIIIFGCVFLYLIKRSPVGHRMILPP
jgi:hypothetical protein